jgi:hypothetical protein
VSVRVELDEWIASPGLRLNSARQIRQDMHGQARPQTARLLPQATKDETHRNGETHLEQRGRSKMVWMELKVLQGKRYRCHSSIEPRPLTAFGCT